MTKDQALPGLRLGYLLAAAEVAYAVEAVRPPWSVTCLRGVCRTSASGSNPPVQLHQGVARERAAIRPGCVLRRRAPGKRTIRSG